MNNKVFLLNFFVLISFSVFSQTVFINNFNYKYHTKDCKKVNKSYYEVDLQGALKNNYKPCSVCKPPILVKDESINDDNVIQSYVVEVDSVKEQRLIEYKKLYEKSLIDSVEYSKLKSNLLVINKPVKKTTKKNKEYLKNLKTAYTSEFVSGSVILGGGLGVVGYGVYYRNNKYPNILNYKTNQLSRYKTDLDSYKQRYKLIIGIGGGISGIGFLLEMLGLKDKLIYMNKTNTVALGLAKENLGLSICFK